MKEKIQEYLQNRIEQIHKWRTDSINSDFEDYRLSSIEVELDNVLEFINDLQDEEL